jgi:hypothetical protein
VASVAKNVAEEEDEGGVLVEAEAALNSSNSLSTFVVVCCGYIRINTREIRIRKTILHHEGRECNLL